MPPKTQFSKQQILDAAIKISSESGISTLTVRKLAGELGCSVAPIYVNFKNTNALIHAVIDQIHTLLLKYITKSYTDIGFFNMGIGQILFVKDYPQLYLDLMDSDHECLKMSKDVEKQMLDIMEKDKMLEGLNRNQNRDLLLKMAIFTEGLSNSITKNSHNITIEDALKLLEETAHQLAYSQKNNFLETYVPYSQINLS